MGEEVKWERVRFTVRCLHGCEIQHGEWALMLRSGHGCCERCAFEKYKLVPKTYELDKAEEVND